MNALPATVPIEGTLVDVDDATSLALHTCMPDDQRGVVVLVHGLFGSKEDFDAVLPRLAGQGFAACAHDQRGCYQSRSAGPFDLETLAEDVVALVEEIGSDIPVHLVGQGFGGLVAGRAALLEPEFWDSVTLVCSGPGGMGMTPALARVLRELAEGRPLVEVRAGFLAETGSADDLPADQVRTRLESTSREAVEAMVRATAEAPDRTAELHATSLDFHVLWGEKADAWPISQQLAMAKALQTRPVVLKGCADHPAEDRPEMTARALVDSFLELD